MSEFKRPLKVFLCHSSADKEKVREVYRYLKKRGIQPWLDAEELLPGQDWALEIPKALEDSDAIIIFLSKGSVNKEGYVQKEIKFALDRALEMPEGRIFIIPARLEPCDLPRSLSKYQWVNFYEEGGAERLLKALKVRGEQLQKMDVEPASGEEALLVLKHVEAESGTLGEALGRISKPRKLDTSIIVALIGVVGTIIAALLGSPLLINAFGSDATATLPSISVTHQTPTIELTSTVTISTSQPQIENNWGEPVSARMPTLNEIREDLLSIWDANGLSLGDMPFPDVRSFTGTANANREYLWPIYWCAIDRPTLDINVENISTVFTVNGQRLPDEYIFDYYYDTNTGWKCNYRASVIGSFLRNSTITLQVTRDFKTDIFDGQVTYPAGSYTYELVLSVK